MLILQRKVYTCTWAVETKFVYSSQYVSWMIKGLNCIEHHTTDYNHSYLSLKLLWRVFLSYDGDLLSFNFQQYYMLWILSTVITSFVNSYLSSKYTLRICLKEFFDAIPKICQLICLAKFHYLHDYWDWPKYYFLVSFRALMVFLIISRKINLVK